MHNSKTINLHCLTLVARSVVNTSPCCSAVRAVPLLDNTMVELPLTELSAHFVLVLLATPAANHLHLFIESHI